MAGRLAGKTAVVMGAGSSGPGWGNGKAIAVLYAREGASVICVDAREAAAVETARIIEGEGGTAVALRADVTRRDDIEAVHACAGSRFGGVDILNNNVGIVRRGDVVETEEADWDQVFAVNLKSCFLAMKVFIPGMCARGGGSIVNTSSVASIRDTGISYVAYASSKAAMNQLTRTTAVRYAQQHVRVNAILPGLMRTPLVETSVDLAAQYGEGGADAMWRQRDQQVPMGHMGEAWDVAWASVFLASDESKYVTGVTLPVDGGITLKY